MCVRAWARKVLPVIVKSFSFNLDLKSWLACVRAAFHRSSSSSRFLVLFPVTRILLFHRTHCLQSLVILRPAAIIQFCEIYDPKLYGPGKQHRGTETKRGLTPVPAQKLAAKRPHEIFRKQFSSPFYQQSASLSLLSAGQAPRLPLEWKY